MKKALSFLLAALLMLSSASALAAYNDYTDYAQFPLVKDGQTMSISVATKRSEQYGKDPEDQWFWIWSKKVTGIDFQVDQILSLHLGLEQGKIKDGTVIAMIAAGIGYAWAANVIRWG